MGAKKRYINDLWSAYRYGDRIKIIYHKRGALAPPAEGFRSAAKAGDAEERFDSSVSRTRAAIFELAACNAFKWFVTLTLDAGKRDRFDLHGFSRAFAQMVRDFNKKRPDGGKVKYLLIPEQHKDGAWHMHGLFMGLTEADFITNSNGYLTWPEYAERFGFFSCEPIRSHEACGRYITKYITKDLKKQIALESGAHAYYASQGLKRRETLVKFSLEPCPFVGDDAWSFENDYVKILWLDAQNMG